MLLNPRRLAVLAGLFGLGFLVYLYLPLRYLAGPAFNYMGSYDAAGNFHPADLTDPVILWQMPTGGSFQGLELGYLASAAMRRAGRDLCFLWGKFLAVCLPLGWVGLAHGWGDPADPRPTREKGSNVQQLIARDVDYNRITGLAQQSAFAGNGYPAAV